MLRVLLKSVDILLGFVIGFLSDMTRTKWGRRRPFIAAGSSLPPDPKPHVLGRSSSEPFASRPMD